MSRFVEEASRRLLSQIEDLSAILNSNSEGALIYGSKRRRGREEAPKVEILRCQEQRKLSSNFLGNKKADRKPDRLKIRMVEHFFIFQKNSLHLKMANFSSLKRRSIFTSRKILREKLELHSASKKSLNIAKMVEKRFELPVSTHDLAYVMETSFSV